MINRKCPIWERPGSRVHEKSAGKGEEGRAVVELGERARKLAQVKTDVVGYRSLARDIYTGGFIEYDERLKALVTAWVPGRIDKLFIDFTGTQVVKNESMVWIYSPELVSTQEEYLLSLETLEKVKDSLFDEVVAGAKSLVDASPKRLLWWGITGKQIEELTKNKRQNSIRLYTPLSAALSEKRRWKDNTLCRARCSIRLLILRTYG